MNDTRIVKGRRTDAGCGVWRICWQALVSGASASCLVLLLAVGARADWYVAPGGNDAQPGTLEQPFATLERARDEVRRAKQAGSVPQGGLVVWLRGGDHLRTTALDLTAEDSGAADRPILWRGYGEERVRLLGGRRLDGFGPVTDPAVLKRLPEAARAKVRRLDLRAAGIQDVGELKSRGFGRSTVPSHGELFYAGRPMTLARWPNEGQFEAMAGFPEGNGQGDDHGGKIGALPGGFLYSGDRPRGWQDRADVWVHGYWAYDWANSYERVESFDLERRWIKTAAPHGLYGFRKGQRFYFLNVFEELDQPGEWYVDRGSGVLYFWPPDGPAAETLLSLSAEPLLRLRGASNVVVSGLVLAATRGNGVEVTASHRVRIEGCRIENIGNSAVVIDGGTENAVVSCDIRDTGDGGVSLSGGDRGTLVPARHVVENCDFRRQGRWSKCYVPAIHMQGVGMRATHNRIQEHPHCAILYGGNDHEIEFNEIHHIALETGDVGAIYTGRDYTFRGNRIRHNFIHHTGGVGMGSMGVYMDDCVSGTEIYGNVFYKVQRAAFLGGGRDHPVVNNVFVECNHAVELDARGLDTSPVWRGMVDETMRNRLGDVPLELYRARYPAMKTLDAHYGPPGGTAIRGEVFHGVPPEGNRVARNVCVGKWLRVGWHAKPETLLLEDNVVGDAPGFVKPITDDARAVDFELRPDSPAWKAGFERIPLERIGLRPDVARRELERRLAR